MIVKGISIKGKNRELRAIIIYLSCTGEGMKELYEATVAQQRVLGHILQYLKLQQTDKLGEIYISRAIDQLYQAGLHLNKAVQEKV